ncbi:MAG: hypothetical protein LC114_09205 [Bryobacterales bacterium]|nr:hypothetical protein [Bryobacterales bacterium]
MLHEWKQILPSAIESLSPLHRELVSYVMALPGTKRPSYLHAKTAWTLSREQFDTELEVALSTIRLFLRRYGLENTADLECE